MTQSFAQPENDAGATTMNATAEMQWRSPLIEASIL